MKELQSIVDAAAEAERNGVQTLLATVVQVEGSTYRRPGAHLLVTGDGRFAGSISGGCLERDLVERARSLTPDGAPALVIYNTTDDDLIFGFGAGCRGVVRILVERPGRDGRPDPVAFIRECLRRRRTGVLATAYQAEGPAAVACGAAVVLHRAPVPLRVADRKVGVVHEAPLIADSGPLLEQQEGQPLAEPGRRLAEHPEAERRFAEKLAEPVESDRHEADQDIQPDGQRAQMAA